MVIIAILLAFLKDGRSEGHLKKQQEARKYCEEKVVEYIETRVIEQEPISKKG